MQHSIGSRYDEMDISFDQEGKLHVHFTEEGIREQKEEKRFERYPYKGRVSVAAELSEK